jgi:6-pyruvoyltetrahydropterin/6-carboxytetrahydropterin synthase
VGYLTLRIEFSALHELKNNSFTEIENKNVFGKCYNLHGHNYFLEVTVEGEINSSSGLCCDREHFRKILKKEIVDKYNGQKLNQFFETTTGEALAKEFHNILKQTLLPLKLFSVRLQETPKNFFYFSDYQSLSC